MAGKKERDNLRTGKERRLDMQQHHDEMIKRSTNERAKEWFNRPAYSIRGDTGGQINSNRVQEYERRD
jgi:hypothetical protein